MRLTPGKDMPWSVVTNVHGASGTSAWRQLVDGHALHGPWEAIELARIPPGGVSGLHRHTRTHEIYFLLAGRGIIAIDDTDYAIVAGDLALTRVGQAHELRAAGDSEVVWLVAEVPATHIMERLLGTSSQHDAVPEEGAMDRTLTPLNLDEIGTLDLASHGVAPLQDAGVVYLAVGESHNFFADDSEVFAFLVEGSADVSSGGAQHQAHGGTGVTFCLGERGTIRATEPTKVFWVRSAVHEAAS